MIFGFFIENHLLENSESLTVLKFQALQAKVLERLSVRLEFPLLILRIHALYLFFIFLHFLLKSLIREHKTELLSLWFKSYRPCRKRPYFPLIFAFFVENHLLGNTKLSILVLWFKSYRLCSQRALYFSLFLDSLLKITY